MQRLMWEVTRLTCNLISGTNATMGRRFHFSSFSWHVPVPTPTPTSCMFSLCVRGSLKNPRFNVFSFVLLIIRRLNFNCGGNESVVLAPILHIYYRLVVRDKVRMVKKLGDVVNFNRGVIYMLIKEICASSMCHISVARCACMWAHQLALAWLLYGFWSRTERCCPEEGYA